MNTYKFYRLLIHSSLPDLRIPWSHTFSTASGFTHLYLLHLFQGLKRLTLLIIETYTLAYHIFKISQFIIYKLITLSNIIYNSIIFNILHFLQTGFTHLYLLHLFQGLKCFALSIIEAYTLAYRIFKISQFNIYKQSNITYFSIIFNILHNYNYQGERTHF